MNFSFRVPSERAVAALILLRLLFTQCVRSGQQGYADRDTQADLVLLEGKVITVDSRDSIAEAVAIKTGRIMAVSRNSGSRFFLDK